jgi:hypothetical protein
MSDLRFHMGDKVVLSPDVANPDNEVYKIVEVPIGRGRVNYVAENIRTGSRTRGRFNCFVRADSTAVAQVEMVPFVEHLLPGDVVKAIGSRWGKDQDAIFTVLAAKRNEQYRIAKLGGDNGRYFDNIPRAMIEKVELTGFTVS